MQLWARLTIVGICAAAGLSLAIAVAMPRNTVGRSGTPQSVQLVAPAPQVATELAISSPAPTPPPQVPVSTAPPAANHEALELNSPGTIRETAQEFFDQAFHRWTATHLPPITRQFEDLQQQAQEAVDKVEQTRQQIAEQNESLQNQLRASLQEADRVAPRSPSRESVEQRIPESLPDPKAPEIAVNDSNDLVSINSLNSDIREVLRTFSEAAGLNILATPSVMGSVSVSLNQVDVQTALNAILKSSGFSSRREGNFLYVGTADELQKMEVAGDDVATRVYRPNYVSGAEFQKLITSMLSPEVGMVSVSTPTEIGITSSKDQAGGDAFAGSDVIVVRDFETVLKKIDGLYQEIDRMPLQVVIEAMILSVRLDDQNTLGVDFELLRNKDNIRLVSGGTADSLANLNFNDGLKIGFLDESLFAFVDALETIGDTHVVASPRVMCLNKQRAEILIGSELGYVSTTVTETAATQAVEFLEVGTHLKIRPFVSSDGMVRLEVHPELSTGTVRVQEGFTLPDKDVTQVTTNVMCRSGATVVLGGLIREDLVVSAQQIPVLGNLPWVGAVFRNRTEDTERREIIVLLTPRIVDDEQMLADGQHAATESRDRRNVFFDKMQHTNKRRIGEKYGRLAISAWTAGDADTAFRYANLAIHYDPLHQNAINLRQEILAVYPDMERGVHNHLRRGLRAWQHPHHDYSADTNWPWREVGAEPQFIQVPPVEAGSPGPVRHILTDEEE